MYGYICVYVDIVCIDIYITHVYVCIYIELFWVICVCYE